MSVVDSQRLDQHLVTDDPPSFPQMPDLYNWLAERRRVNQYRVEVVPLDGLDGWRTEPDTGDLAHRSNRFFAIQGLDVRTDHREVDAWMQPIINQPEVGILGILTRVFGGIRRYLMQVKLEPGNINGLQLAPTVQATHSNYTGVHRGGTVPYLEHFRKRRRANVRYDALQSEQGSWFLSKRNRNMIIEVPEEVPVSGNFCWLSREQLAQLMRVDNLVNMDARSVLSGIAGATNPLGDGPALHSTTQLLSWLTEARARYRLQRKLIPIVETKRWNRTPMEITHEDGLFFRIIGVDVQASHREVARWSQPMLAPRQRGINAFLGRRIADQFHVLVHAHTEAGTFDVVELGPTVSCSPENYRYLPTDRRPRFLDLILGADPLRALFDVVHSEEGGRLYHAENRDLIIDVGDDVPLDVPDDFIWMTPAQLARLARYGNVVNIAARSLLTCLAL